jgi:drug/metabolite transporter (DMT)-like permease
MGVGLYRLLAGIAVSFGGAVVVGISTSSAGRASLLGILLCLVAAVSYAASAVSQKSALRCASPLQVTTFGCAIGALACLSCNPAATVGLGPPGTRYSSIARTR